MTSPVSPPASTDAPLQFDRAEFTEPPPAPRCTACQRAITRTYFEVNSHLLCPECRDTVEASMVGGSKSKRFLTATVFGIGAGIAGAAVYYGVSLTGYNIGLIAVLVGWMVGTAVFKGSDGRGGAGYQVLAILLTYLSVAGSLAPDVYKELTAQPVEAATGEAPAEGESLSPGGNVVFAGIISVAAPVLVGMNSPLSGLIYGFALYEAWRRNKRAELNIAGPFQLAEAAPASEEAAPERQEQSVG